MPRLFRREFWTCLFCGFTNPIIFLNQFLLLLAARGQNAALPLVLPLVRVEHSENHPDTPGLVKTFYHTISIYKKLLAIQFQFHAIPKVQKYV